MAEMILDFGYGVTGTEHMNGAGMSKTVNRVQVAGPFFRKGFLDIFPADFVDSVSCYDFTALVDEKVLFE